MKCENGDRVEFDPYRSRPRKNIKKDKADTKPKVYEKGERERIPEDEGVCESCGEICVVFVTEYGEFCQKCRNKMSFLK